MFVIKYFASPAWFLNILTTVKYYDELLWKAKIDQLWTQNISKIS